MSLTEIVIPDNAKLEGLARSLQQGELVAIPTETVYGLAGNAFDPLAVAKIFEVKERPSFDPLIVHHSFCDPALPKELLDDLHARGIVDLSKMSDEMRSDFYKLAESFWPGALTLIVPKGAKIPDLVTSGLDFVGIRYPKHPVTRQLIASAGIPLAAPSANRFGRISPTSATDVKKELDGRIAWVIDGGACEIGVESTILKLGDETLLLRSGGVSKLELESCLNRKIVSAQSIIDMNQVESAMNGPGMLSSHYSPTTKMIFLDKPIEALERFPFEIATSIKIGLLAQRGLIENKKLKLQNLGVKDFEVKILSESQTGELKVVAQNLFSYLRILDESDVDIIIAEPCWTQAGLGVAINDRLMRASHIKV